MQGTVLVIIYQERKTPNRTENEKRGGHYINPKTETESFLKYFLINTRL